MLSQGQSLDQIMESLGSVAEGVATAPAAYRLCQKLGVDAPIISSVYRVICENADLRQEFHRITNREPKSEITH